MLKDNFFIKIISGLSVLFLSACTQVGLGVANIPSKFSDVEIVKDIAYGEETWQKLDLYLPPQAKDKALPVLVFFYGGRWTDGRKEMYSFIGDLFAKENYIVAIADYSKYPDVKFPTFVEDGAKATAWVYKNIEQYNGDIQNVFISGHSSGAHIGALVTADERYLQAEGVSHKFIRGFAGLAGPYDFIPVAEDLKDMFGPPEKYPQMRVTSFIEGDEPPMLLLWGAEDKAVYRRNIDLLEKEIQNKNGIVEAHIYEDVDHVDIISTFTWFLKDKAPVKNDMLNFFNKHKNK